VTIFFDASDDDREREEREKISSKSKSRVRPEVIDDSDACDTEPSSS